METVGAFGRLGMAGFTEGAAKGASKEILAVSALENGAGAEGMETPEVGGFGKESPAGGTTGVGVMGGFGTLKPEGAGAGIPGTEGGLMPNVGADGGLIAEADMGGLIAANDGAGGVILAAGAGGTKEVVTGTGLGGKFNLGPTSALGGVGLLV